MKNEDRYAAALHAMQTGVAQEGQLDPSDAALTPKHLRVGINSALVSNAALARLLVAKGIITEAEYVAALADDMEREVKRYEVRLSERLGAKVTLA